MHLQVGCTNWYGVLGIGYWDFSRRSNFRLCHDFFPVEKIHAKTCNPLTKSRSTNIPCLQRGDFHPVFVYQLGAKFVSLITWIALWSYFCSLFQWDLLFQEKVRYAFLRVTRTTLPIRCSTLQIIESFRATASISIQWCTRSSAIKSWLVVQDRSST